MECPKCKSTKLQKKGLRAGKQRYRCTACGANFTEGKEYRPAPRYPKIVEQTCPKCGSDNIIRDGKLKNGIQRYQCNKCGLNFSAKAILCDTEKTRHKCPYCNNLLTYYSYIAPRVHDYECSHCGAHFHRLPKVDTHKEEMISLILNGKNPSIIAQNYNYSIDHLRKIMTPYYKKEKITAEQKKNIIRYGFYLNVPVDYMAEYIKCSEHKCKEVLHKFKKEITSTTHDAIE